MVLKYEMLSILDIRHRKWELDLGNPVHGGQINSYLDHRIAMAFSIAALAAEGNTEIQNGQCVDVSYPSFFTELHSLSL